jgi:site-specific recombinase XerD
MDDIRHVIPAGSNHFIHLVRRDLRVELEQLDFEKARQRRRLPVVLVHTEVARILEQLSGKYRIMVELLYGAGLRQPHG